MNKKQEANAFVRECLTTALVQLMQEQPFDGIAITDLVRRAGVSRVSFYRNFTSKKNVLEQHLMSLIQEWGREFEDRGDPGYFSESLLRHCYLHRDFYLLLYRHGLSDLIYEAIRTAARLEDAKDNMERYGRSLVAGMIWGWLDEWMRQGMPETPDEIVLLTAHQHP